MRATSFEFIMGNIENLYNYIFDNNSKQYT